MVYSLVNLGYLITVDLHLITTPTPIHVYDRHIFCLLEYYSRYEIRSCPDDDGLPL